MYNRCKLTRLVVDTVWDSRVWRESWQDTNLGDRMEKNLAEAGLLPTPDEEVENEEKRKKSKQKQGHNKRMKLDNNEVWRCGERNKLPESANS